MNDTAATILGSPEFSEFIFNNLTSAIFLVDRDFRVRKINATFASFFSASQDEALGKLCGNAIGCSHAVEANADCGTTEACADCDIRSSLTGCFFSPDNTKTNYLTRNLYIDGTAQTKHFRLKTRFVAWNGEELAIVVIDDITELEEQKRQIQDMANHDFLTGLKNRRCFFDSSESLFWTAKRGDLSIAVAMFDIDHFKTINDTFGHAAGDFILKSVSDILERNIRKSDILSRFGGEEFCLLLHCREAGDPFAVVDKLRRLVGEHAYIHEEKEIRLTISAGVTTQIGENLDGMIQKADALLYRAKETGRNRTVDDTEQKETNR